MGRTIYCCECFLAERNTILVKRWKKTLTSIINASIKQKLTWKQHLSSFSAIFFLNFVFRRNVFWWAKPKLPKTDREPNRQLRTEVNRTSGESLPLYKNSNPKNRQLTIFKPSGYVWYIIGNIIMSLKGIMYIVSMLCQRWKLISLYVCYRPSIKKKDLRKEHSWSIFCTTRSVGNFLI